MDLIIFDTETTGLLGVSKKANPNIPGSVDKYHEVIQFSAIILSEGLKITRVINRYCEPTQPISDAATKVHGLTDDMIHRLSNGKSFLDVVMEEKLYDLDNVTWVAYSVNFDIKMINQTLLQLGSTPINFGRRVNDLSFEKTGTWYYDLLLPIGGICGLHSSVKLSYAVDRHIGTTTYKLLCEKFRSDYGLIDPIADEICGNNCFHNSLFDAFAACLLINKFKNNLFE